MTMCESSLSRDRLPQVFRTPKVTRRSTNSFALEARLVRKLLVGAIRLYQMFLSPVLFAIAGPSCRFTPSCSQYAIEAVSKHGALKGSWYALRRILRCQPLCKGGYDPVP